MIVEQIPIEDRKLEFATKNGIRIGMTRQEVVEKLGTPTRTAVRGNAREYWCALYKKVVMKDRERGHVLRNTYIFKHGKLIKIAINLDSVPAAATIPFPTRAGPRQSSGGVTPAAREVVSRFGRIPGSDSCKGVPPRNSQASRPKRRLGQCKG